MSPPGKDDLYGLPRAGLRSALRRAAAAAGGAGAEARGPAGAGEAGGAGGGSLPRLVELEERFPGSGGGYPADLFGPAFAWGLPQAAPLVFWDLETCGLADEPIFLMGALRPEGAGLRLSAVLARDPSGEPALLRRAAETLGNGAVWVTFNGRSFDAPRLRRRAALHGIDLPEPAGHLDLLREVRRRFGQTLPDCRLGTVERRLLGLERSPGDAPGREAPERYRDFVRTGEMRWITPVLLHNRRDVAAMAVLYRRLAPERGAPEQIPAEHLPADDRPAGIS
jgi:hypothetical protein